MQTTSIKTLKLKKDFTSWPFLTPPYHHPPHHILLNYTNILDEEYTHFHLLQLLAQRMLSHWLLTFPRFFFGMSHEHPVNENKEIYTSGGMQIFMLEHKLHQP